MATFPSQFKNLEKWEEAISHANVYAFCIPRQAYLYIVFLCLLELLVVKNYVELEKKTASGKNKG